MSSASGDKSEEVQERPYYRYRDALVQFINTLSSTAANAAQQLEAMVSSPDAKATFATNAAGVPIISTLGLVGLCRASFPDFTFNVFLNTYKECLESHTASVLVQVSGTHSGAPYAFPPGSEPLAPSGRRIDNAVEPFRLTFDAAGKITRFEVLPTFDGSVSGPTGLYLHAGGKLLPSKQHFAIMKRFIDVVSSSDMQAILPLFATDGVIKFIGDAEIKASDLVVMMGKFFRPAFPDFGLRMFEDTYQEVGDMLSMEVQAEGHQTGPFSAPPVGAVDVVPPSGKALSIPREKITLYIDAERRIRLATVATMDGTVPGFARVYEQLGGKLSEADRNILVVKRMYAAFKRGDVDGILAHTLPNVDWCWGEEDGSLSRRLPWYGRWVGAEGIRTGFRMFGMGSEPLHFEPELWFVSHGCPSTVLVLTTVIVRRRGTTNERCVTLAHRFEFTQAGKLAKYREYQDTLFLSPLYK